VLRPARRGISPATATLKTSTKPDEDFSISSMPSETILFLISLGLGIFFKYRMIPIVQDSISRFTTDDTGLWFSGITLQNSLCRWFATLSFGRDLSFCNICFRTSRTFQVSWQWSVKASDKCGARQNGRQLNVGGLDVHSLNNLAVEAAPANAALMSRYLLTTRSKPQNDTWVTEST
jgi:hypothetical protein